MRKLKSFFQACLHKKDYLLARHPIRQFFREQNFDLILDVGANRGQYVSELRKNLGYQGHIVSFEPLSEARKIIKEKCVKDDRWQVVECALGSESGTSTIHVAGNLASSSLLEMLPRHTDAAPTSAMVSTETIEVKRLDEIFDEWVPQGSKRILMKIDTQGFELEVLKGAKGVIDQVDALQLELNATSLYKDAPFAEVVMAHVRELGFEPFWFTHGLRNPQTNQLYQFDGWFVRARSGETG